MNNCIPDDLLAALKQTDAPREYLGPGTKRVLQPLKSQVKNLRAKFGCVKKKKLINLIGKY